MKLHQDKEAFSALLSDVSRRTGIRGDIIEKDYYLTLLLSELAARQDSLPAYFKGGTALYKAIGRMKRFSEDIDLTVEAHDCTKSQGKKRLETATQHSAGLQTKRRRATSGAALPAYTSTTRSRWRIQTMRSSVSVVPIAAAITRVSVKVMIFFFICLLLLVIGDLKYNEISRGRHRI